MTKYRRMRAEAGWSAKTYLAEVWGFDSIADVDAETWDGIEERAKKRSYFDVVLIRAKRRFLSGEYVDG